MRGKRVIVTLCSFIAVAMWSTAGWSAPEADPIKPRVPDAERGEARRRVVVVGLAEEDLAGRERQRTRIAEHADRQLATLDELFDERVGVELLVDELRALERLVKGKWLSEKWRGQEQ